MRIFLIVLMSTMCLSSFSQELFIDEVDPFTDQITRRTTFKNGLGKDTDKINLAGYREGDDFFLLVGTYIGLECGGMKGSSITFLMDDKSKITLSDVRIDIDCENKLDFYKFSPKELHSKTVTAIKLVRNGKYGNFIFNEPYSLDNIIGLLVDGQ